MYNILRQSQLCCIALFNGIVIFLIILFTETEDDIICTINKDFKFISKTENKIIK